MSRSTRTLLVLVFSLLVASAASFIVYRRCSHSRARDRGAELFGRSGGEGLPIGTMLTTSDVKLVAWPQSSPVAGAFTTVEEVVNRGLLSGVVENEPLTPAKVAVAEAAPGSRPRFRPACEPSR